MAAVTAPFFLTASIIAMARAAPSVGSVPAPISSKRINYLGMYLTKKVKDLYSENYKTLMKEVEADTKKWKDISCS